MLAAKQPAIAQLYPTLETWQMVAGENRGEEIRRCESVGLRGVGGGGGESRPTEGQVEGEKGMWGSVTTCLCASDVILCDLHTTAL